MGSRERSRNRPTIKRETDRKDEKLRRKVVGFKKISFKLRIKGR
jgi:hypothetical protein